MMVAATRVRSEVGGILNYFVRVGLGPWRSLGARLNGIQKVRGSNPLGSTKFLSAAGIAFLDGDT